MVVLVSHPKMNEYISLFCHHTSSMKHHHKVSLSTTSLAYIIYKSALHFGIVQTLSKQTATHYNVDECVYVCCFANVCLPKTSACNWIVWLCYPLTGSHISTYPSDNVVFSNRVIILQHVGHANPEWKRPRSARPCRTLEESTTDRKTQACPSSLLPLMCFKIQFCPTPQSCVESHHTSRDPLYMSLLTRSPVLLQDIGVNSGQ